jgi:hypothetical protein
VRNHVVRAALCVVVIIGAVRPTLADEIIDRVLAVAGGNVIMLSDVIAARDLGLVPTPTSADPLREILSRLIERALVLGEVDRYAPPEPEAAEVDEALRTVHARFTSMDMLNALLARVGMTEDHLRETLRGDLRIRAYLEQRFTVGPPGDEELGRFYREHPELFTRDGALVPFEAMRQQVVAAAAAERRRTLAGEWIAGLRRRADVIDLYEK